jgi:hypothetical protein
MNLRSAAPAAGATDRRRHYAAFYGLDPLPEGAPLALVHGNCQAESLRVVLGGPDLATVRIPPAHELTGDDLAPLGRLLARAELVITQPIRSGYRGLPIGTADVLAQTPARAIVVPVIRFAGLYPAQVLIRPPGQTSLVPPLVPYHDLRVLAEAAGGRADRAGIDGDRVRAVARHSLEQLRTRELAHGAVAISDLFAEPGFDQMRTINHPGNEVWKVLARRVRAAAGVSDVVHDPGRPLLDAIHAPREAAVIDALRLDEAPRPDWIVDGEPVATAAVREAHLRWYEDHPATVTEGLERHREVRALLGRG